MKLTRVTPDEPKLRTGETAAGAAVLRFRHAHLVIIHGKRGEASRWDPDAMRPGWRIATVGWVPGGWLHSPQDEKELEEADVPEVRALGEWCLRSGVREARSSTRKELVSITRAALDRYPLFLPPVE